MSVFGKLNTLRDVTRGFGTHLANEARQVSGALLNGGTGSVLSGLWHGGYAKHGAIGAALGGGYGFATSNRRNRWGDTSRGALWGGAAGMAGRAGWNIGKHYAPNAYGRVTNGITSRMIGSKSAGMAAMGQDIRSSGWLGGVAQSIDRKWPGKAAAASGVEYFGA